MKNIRLEKRIIEEVENLMLISEQIYGNGNSRSRYRTGLIQTIVSFGSCLIKPNTANKNRAI